MTVPLNYPGLSRTTPDTIRGRTEEIGVQLSSFEEWLGDMGTTSVVR